MRIFLLSCLIVAAPLSAAFASDNPWPDAYGRRSYQLGMSLADFKAAPWADRDNKDNDGGFPVCSDEKRAKDTDYMTADVVPDQYKASEMISCTFFVKYKGTVSAIGLGLGDVTYPKSYFYFLPDDSGTQRLFWVVTRAAEDNFDRLLPIFQKAYGEPEHSTTVVKNGLGASFTNDSYTWTNSSSQIVFSRYAGSLDESHLEHRLLPLWSKLEQIDAAEDAKRAGKL